MDEVLKTMMLQAPNVMVALWTLYWTMKRLEDAQEFQQQMLERLSRICEKCNQVASEESVSSVP